MIRKARQPGGSALGWVERAVGGSVVGHEPIAGATSSEVYRIALRDRPVVVLRLFTNQDWLTMEPDLAQHEAAALEVIGESPVPTPRLLAFDARGSQAGCPAVLMTEIPGSVVLRPTDPDAWLDGLAGSLATLHEFEVEFFPWIYRTWQDLDHLTVPDWSDRPSLWADVILRVQQGVPRSPARFIHRDFHPTNVLWSEGSVVGVVDWVNACLGPPDIDVAHCRLNLARMYGTDEADTFALRYQTLTGRSADPAWDLLAAVETLPEATAYQPWSELGLTGLDTPTARTRLEQFAAAALARLG